MGLADRVETVFRERLHDERKARRLSQAELAKMLNARGVPAYPTTVAKIESGERSVKLDEIAAIADIFGVSIDTFIGRQSNPARDKQFIFGAMARELEQAGPQISQVQTNLMILALELEDYVLDRSEERLRSGVIEIAEEARRIAGAIGNAHKACTKTIKFLDVDDQSEGATK